MANMNSPLGVDIFCRVHHITVRPLHDRTSIKMKDSKEVLELVPYMVVVLY